MGRLNACFAILFLLFQNTYCRECTDFAIGLTHKEQIPDHYFTATSSYDTTSQPFLSRLNSKTSWKPRHADDSNDYLQIDLGLDYRICAIATKGGRDSQWTRKYLLSFSIDNKKWIRYEENGKVKVFNGNIDQDTPRKNILMARPIARFVRLQPVSYKGWKAIRLELFGVYIDNCKLPLGLENYGIDDNHISTNHQGRLYGMSSWKPSINEKYMYIDLGEMKFVTGIATQGDPHLSLWVTSFILEFKSVREGWYEYTPSEDEESFPGNVDNTGIAVHWFHVKHHIRCIRITPKTWHHRIALRVELYGCGSPCESQPIETFQRGVVQGIAQHDGNANDTMKRDLFCFDDKSTIQQIDLGIPYLVCALSILTTGSDYWVEGNYMLQTSVDGKTWTKNNRQQTQMMSFNSHGNSGYKDVLHIRVTARYLRFSVDYSVRRCMKVRLYGISVDTCSKSIAGASSTGQLPHYRFTASSQISQAQGPAHGRLFGPSCWSPKTNDDLDYLQVDLGDPWTVCAVATQGFQDEMVSSYNIAFSMNGNVWIFYKYKSHRVVLRQHGSITRNVLATAVSARFVRFYPLTYKKKKSMKIEIYGARQSLQGSLGVEQRHGVRHVSDRQLSASETLDSLHTERQARLYGLSSWCTKQSHNPYFQVDLRSPMQVVGIATQGDPVSGHYIQRYDLQYSFTSDYWRIIDALVGNHDSEDVKVEWFNPSLGARYIRLVPTRWHGTICLRMDLYGNDNAPPPVITAYKVIGQLLPTSSSHVTIQCVSYAAPFMQLKWFSNGSDVTERSRGLIYSRGKLISYLQVNYTSEIADRCAGRHICSLVYGCQGKYKDNWGERKEAKIVIDMRKAITSVKPEYEHSTNTPTIQQIVVTQNSENIQTDASLSLRSFSFTLVLSVAIVIVQYW